MPEVGVWTEPLRGYQFVVELGEDRAYFIEVSNISAEVAPIAFRAGGMRETVHYLAGQPSYSEMRLRFGVTTSNAFWDWFKHALNGTPQRRNISVIMLDAEGASEQLRWNLVAAWPTRMTAAAMDSMRSEIAIEEMSVIYEKIDRVAQSGATAASA